MGEGEEKQRMEKGSRSKDGACHSINSQNRPSSSSSRKAKRKVENYAPELPLDVLNIIANKLDIDDLFSFGQVNKNWRTCQSSIWHNFFQSQAPLVIQKSTHAKRACSFFSINESRMYNSLLPNFFGFRYAGFSSGYLMMAGAQKTLMLINPFKRRQIRIPTTQNQGYFSDLYDKVILAYAVNSQEYVIVASCTWAGNLHVYQSRNSVWTIYSRWGYPLKVVDAVVHDHTLYAITHDAKIGKFMLNSSEMNFLKLNNTPIFLSTNMNLVSSDGQLLVVHFEAFEYLEVYKIDLSAMEWIRIYTIGDCALFMSGTKCTSLSNPGMWGFDNNCVYSINRISPVCMVFALNNKLITSIPLPENQSPLKARLCNYDWCFLHRREQIDYTHHE